jgi:hypothetical protein
MNFVGFEVLASKVIRSSISIGCNAVYSVESQPTVSEEHVASIFEVEE